MYQECEVNDYTSPNLVTKGCISVIPSVEGFVGTDRAVIESFSTPALGCSTLCLYEFLE